MRQAVKGLIRAYTGTWAPRTRIFLVHDIATWVVGQEMQELGRIARRLGIRVEHPFFMALSGGQAVFYGSQFFLLGDDWLRSGHAVGTAYFHGRPGTGYEDFDRLYERLRRHHERIARIQVSHSEMEQVVLESGIESGKVFRIPIGINLELFSPGTPKEKRRVRERHGIPLSAVVAGSFQKDGSGWGEGMEPKPVKGPDVLLRALGLLKERVPELFVLLTGPARGFVRKGLDEMSIPYRHLAVEKYADVAALYRALDVYIVPSRQEGGPKAVLEAMASGVPLVTTRVGQAMDIVVHGENGCMVEVEDAEGLAHWAEWAVSHRTEASKMAREGLATARNHSYESQVGMWRRFMEGYAL